MALWNRNSGRGGASYEEITLKDALQKYNLEYVEDTSGMQFAVASNKGTRSGGGISGSTGGGEGVGPEIGTASVSPFTSFIRQEYNSALRGIQGLEAYDKMRRSDGGVRSTLRGVKMPVLAARWFVEAASDDPQDKEIAAFVEKCLFSYMGTPWHQTITEALLMLDFGYYMFEKVWENKVIDGKMRTILNKLGPRHPMDVRQWDFDANGGPNYVEMYGNMMLNNSQDIQIPIEKLLVFTFDKEASNIQGISVLRSAYKHWYYKEQLYKIDAIQKERHGIGIPVIVLPMGYTKDDKAAAENLGRNIRTNERAHIVLPPGWELKMLKLEGNPVDCLASIEHHDTMIRLNVLGEFFVGNSTPADQMMFLKATRFIADIICETFNAYLIPQLCDFNYNVENYPLLKVRRIGESADWRTLSFAIRNLIGSGVIIPDETLEDNIREEMDLPAPDKETARLIATPQNPFDVNEELLAQLEHAAGGSGDVGESGNVGGGSGDVHNNQSPLYNRRPRQTGHPIGGLPRQAPIGSQSSNGGPFSTPGGNAGKDGSGGK